jgi:hypothetical protein
MTNLSPAAQEVLDAWSDNTLYTRDKEPQALAAALRAVADHVEWPADVSLRIIASELERQ